MIRLIDKEGDTLIGEIDEQQLQFLIDQFEEESADDNEYHLNLPTLQMLQEEYGPSDLLDLLVEAMGTRDEMELRWEAATEA